MIGPHQGIGTSYIFLIISQITFVRHTYPMKQNIISVFLCATVMTFMACGPRKSETVASVAGPGELDRTVLPVKAPAEAFDTTLDARNGKAPTRFEVKAPAKAPNVVIVLIDDMGFGIPH